MGRGAMEITQLLFSNDSLIFMEATIQSAYTLNLMLEKYQYHSGQLINTQKSVMFCAKPVANPSPTTNFKHNQLNLGGANGWQLPGHSLPYWKIQKTNFPM